MRHNKVHKMEEPNPFWEEEGDDCTEGSVAFRYRKFHVRARSTPRLLPPAPPPHATPHATSLRS